MQPSAAIPASFGKLGVIDLSNWTGGDHPELSRLIGYIRSLAERPESRLGHVGATLSDDWTLTTSERAITTLHGLTDRIGALGEVLVDDADRTTDLRAALMEVGATYRVVNEAIERFVKAGLDPAAVDRWAYAELARGNLLDCIQNGRGSCGRIRTLYRRAGGLRQALVAKASPRLRADVDEAFRELSTADYDLFREMEELGRALTNEARVIENLFLIGQADLARQRIVEGWTRLKPLEDKLQAARDDLRDILERLGYAEQTSTETGAVQVTIQKISIGGSVVNSNVVVAESIERSSLTVTTAAVDGELKTALEELHKAVAALTTKLPDDEAALAARNLEDLTREATSATPRPAFWRQASEGLLNAAKRVAEVGGPVVDLVTKVTSLLGA